MATNTEEKEAKTDEKPVEKGKEPLWSKNGLLIMIGVWVLTLGLGIAGVVLFMGAPTSTGVNPDAEGDSGGSARKVGTIERVSVSVVDQQGESRTVTFSLLLDFGEHDEARRAELEQGDFKRILSYRAEEAIRGYTVRQISENSFPRKFGADIRDRFNELFSMDGDDFVRSVYVQNVAVSN